MTIVAVLGTGSIGTRHLRILASMKGVTPVAIPVRVERQVQLSLEGYQVADNLRSAAQIGSDLCIVATDTSRHVEDGISALENGLDVLMEKPLASDSIGANELNRHANKLGRRLFVGCVMRFSASLNAFYELRDRVGQPHAVQVECRSYLPDWRPDRPYRHSYSAKSGEGGVMLDLIHEIDYAGWMFGWPDATFAKIQNLSKLDIESEEKADIHWETSSGCTVSVYLDYLTRPTRRRMTVYGELGTIEWDGVEGVTRLAIQDHPIEEIVPIQTRDQMFRSQTQAFIDASNGRSDFRLATAEEGVKALAVCDAARKSSEIKREILVEYPEFKRSSEG